ncbi:hypothetical protein [uncultured Duncaniella sp.]|uniref:hypothetical protein n=1 Tax=uncultured Duncaniella sp. TaxID=2768039 RepID=UPI002676E88C|nr:hypothetical protein [uncultured Duncaniella sp.]
MDTHTIQIYGKRIKITGVPIRIGSSHISNRGHNRKLPVLQKSQRLIIVKEQQPMSRLAILLVKYNRIVPPHPVATVINLRGEQLTGGFAITDPSTVPHLLTKPKPVLVTLNLLKRNNDLPVTQRSPLKQRLNKFTNLKLRQLVMLILQQI